MKIIFLCGFFLAKIDIKPSNIHVKIIKAIINKIKDASFNNPTN
jgi:hypothetical protein